MKMRVPKTSGAARAAQDEVLRTLTEDSINDDMADGQSSNENSSSHGHSSSDPSTTDPGSNAGKEEPVSEICDVTKQDNKNVNRSKFLVYLSLVLAATTVGTLT